jgi:hypothetical protein
MLTLSKLINLSSLDLAPSAELPATLFPDITDSLPIKIPVYGELLVYEAKILESLQGKVTSHLNRFFKLFTLLNYVPQGLEAMTNLITELQLGHVTRVTNVLVEYDSAFWHGAEVAKLLEEGASLENGGFDGLLEEYYTTWAEATGVYIPAQLLDIAISQTAYQVNVVEKVDVDAEQLLKDCHLEWADLYCYQDLLTPDVDLCILLALRTDIWNYNVLGSLPVSQATKMKDILRKEIGTVGDAITHNANVETLGGKLTEAAESSDATSVEQASAPKKSRKSATAKSL